MSNALWRECKIYQFMILLWDKQSKFNKAKKKFRQIIFHDWKKSWTEMRKDTLKNNCKGAIETGSITPALGDIIFLMIAEFYKGITNCAGNIS